MPTASSAARRRPSLVVPSNAASASFTLTSSNGSPANGTPTIVNLASGTSGCEQTSAQLTCTVDLTAPVGSLVYSVKLYSAQNAGGTLIAEGNAAVTTTSGTTTDVSASIGGTLAAVKVSLASYPVPEGNPATIPVTLEALDASGNVILGTYDTPIALSDSDTSGATTLSTTSITSSSQTVTLAYSGAAIASAPTISAVSGSHSATATLALDTTNPTVNGESLTFSQSSAYSSATNASPTPIPAFPETLTETVTTDVPFNGLANAISVESKSTTVGDITRYYAWASTGATTVLEYLGASGNLSHTCTAPYQTDLVLPLPSPGSGWSAYQSAGSCTSLSNGKTTVNGDGSYAASESSPFGSADANVAADGSGSFVINESFISSIHAAATIAAPGTSATIPESLATSSTTINPSATPSPTATSIPNFLAPGSAATAWMTTPPNGYPSPLQSDTFVVKGSVAVPASCTGSGSVLSGLSGVTEVDESSYRADPFQAGTLTENAYLYEATTVQHYFVNGIGDACDVYTLQGVAVPDPTAYLTQSAANYTTVLDQQSWYLTAASGVTIDAARRAMSATAGMPRITALFAAANVARASQRAERNLTSLQSALRAGHT